MRICPKCGERKISKNNDFNAISADGYVICRKCGEQERRETLKNKRKNRRLPRR